jgi:hypothetical protein
MRCVLLQGSRTDIRYRGCLVFETYFAFGGRQKKEDVGSFSIFRWEDGGCEGVAGLEQFERIGLDHFKGCGFRSLFNVQYTGIAFHNDENNNKQQQQQKWLHCTCVAGGGVGYQVFAVRLVCSSSDSLETKRYG